MHIVTFAQCGMQLARHSKVLVRTQTGECKVYIQIQQQCGMQATCKPRTSSAHACWATRIRTRAMLSKAYILYIDSEPCTHPSSTTESTHHTVATPCVQMRSPGHVYKWGPAARTQMRPLPSMPRTCYFFHSNKLTACQTLSAECPLLHVAPWSVSLPGARGPTRVPLQVTMDTLAGSPERLTVTCGNGSDVNPQLRRPPIEGVLPQHEWMRSWKLIVHNNLYIIVYLCALTVWNLATLTSTLGFLVAFALSTHLKDPGCAG